MVRRVHRVHVILVTRVQQRRHLVRLLRGTIRPTQAVPHCRVLPVVVVEQLVVDRVVARRVQKVAAKVHLVVNRDSPEVHHHKKTHEEYIVQGEQINKDVVRHTLTEAVDRVEGVRGEGRRELVRVMQLMDVLIDDRVMQATVEAVHHEVCECEEQHGREEEVGPAVIGDVVVHFAVAAVREDSSRHHQYCHERDGARRYPDLVLDLSPQLRHIVRVDRLGEELLLQAAEVDVVGQRSEGEVHEGATRCQDQPKNEHLMRQFVLVHRQDRRVKVKGKVHG